jgi:hypothetical protein
MALYFERTSYGKDPSLQQFKVTCTEEQIIKVLKEVETGRKIQDVCRAHGISEQTYRAP